MHTHDAYDTATKATWVTIIINFFLGLLKIVAGLVGNSWAIVADGLHTMSDLLSSTAVLIGLRVARKAPDKTHPYGHGKAEVLAARFVGFLLLAVGAFILHESIGKLSASDDVIVIPKQIALWAALISIVVKEGLYRYKRHFAMKTGSTALKADAWHHRSDALTSLAALIGVAGAIVGGEKLYWLDPAAAMAVAGVVLWVAFHVFTSTMHELMDAAAPTEVIDAIRRVASLVPGVMGVEKIYCRKTGLSYLVDIHVEVDPKMAVDEAHEIAQAVQTKLVREGENILQALVHIEPYYPDDH